MKIKDLKSGDKLDKIKVKIVAKEEAHDIPDSQTKVSNGICKDDTGEAGIALWGEHSAEVCIDDTIEISNGYVKEWMGQLYIQVGKYAKIKKMPTEREKMSIEEIVSEKEKISYCMQCYPYYNTKEMKKKVETLQEKENDMIKESIKKLAEMMPGLKKRK